jgi:4-amino-4-deoxy-L-arabinose transferase-like glycosyltransferase
VYPYAIALALQVAPRGTPPRLAVGVLQIIASALTMGLIYLLAQELFDRRSGLLAAGMFGFYPAFAAHTHLLWSDFLTLLPLVAALLLAVRAHKSGRHLTALAAGAAFGFTALTREFAFWFIPIASIWLMVSSGISRRRTIAGALVVAGALLVVLPWTVRNYRAHNEFVLIATNSWTPLYLANNNDPRPWVGLRFYEDFIGRDMERERFAREHALEVIVARQPGWVFDRLAIAVPKLLSVENFPLRHLRFELYGENVPRWVKLVAVIATVSSYVALLSCFSIGVMTVRWNAGRLLVLLFMLFAAAVVVPFPIVSRYRLPLEALATPFAAAWLTGAEATRDRLGPGPRVVIGGPRIVTLLS